MIINREHQYEGHGFSRILWQALRCSVCSRGAVAQIHDNGNSQTAVLGDFLPYAIEKAVIPAVVPPDIVKEFRESELNRPRSVPQRIGNVAFSA